MDFHSNLMPVIMAIEQGGNLELFIQRASGALKKSQTAGKMLNGWNSA